jgi:hypothetical protein
VLGIPGTSQSAFEEIDWDTIAAKGDSLIEVAGSAESVTQSWHHGGPSGQQVIAYEFRLNVDRRLATARTRLHAASFPEALAGAQDVLDSYLSVMSFHHDVPAEAVAWRVTEERTGTVHFAMKFLGKVKQLDTSLTLLSTPELRELLSTWREAVNAATPMGQALGFYKIIERVHKYRVEREARTRETDKHYLPPRETIPEAIQDLVSDYEMMSESFHPYLGKEIHCSMGARSSRAHKERSRTPAKRWTVSDARQISRRRSLSASDPRLALHSPHNVAVRTCRPTPCFNWLHRYSQVHHVSHQFETEGTGDPPRR